jgi:hypothetical protein
MIKPEVSSFFHEDSNTVCHLVHTPGDGRFSNTDLAFQGDLVFVGNYHGFNVYDISEPGSPRLRTSVICPGGQGDVSVFGNLVFMSAQETRGRVDCGTQGVEEPVSAERFRGVRVFDISDLDNPVQVAAVQTCRGSHTHTVVTDPGDSEVRVGQQRRGAVQPECPDRGGRAHPDMPGVDTA